MLLSSKKFGQLDQYSFRVLGPEIIVQVKHNVLILEHVLENKLGLPLGQTQILTLTLTSHTHFDFTHTL